MSRKGKNFAIDMDVKELVKTLDLSDELVDETSALAVQDMTDELTRIASEIAPIDKGTLRIKHTQKVKKNLFTGMFEGHISFSVLEGDFNYALWIHEGAYELGEQSKASPGTQGWSGKHYDVGRKYLSRPLEGEREAFLEYFAVQIQKAVEGV